jgi:hypothetical protein
MSTTVSDNLPQIVLAATLIMITPVFCGVTLGILIWFGYIALCYIRMRWDQRQQESGHLEPAQLDEVFHYGENEEGYFSDSSNEIEESSQADSGYSPGSNSSLDH